MVCCIRKIFQGEKFRVLVQNENFAEKKRLQIAPLRPIIMWVWPQNLAEKTFVNCSGTSNYYVGVATKFSGENFRELLRYVQSLCGCGHKI